MGSISMVTPWRGSGLWTCRFLARRGSKENNQTKLFSLVWINISRWTIMRCRKDNEIYRWSPSKVSPVLTRRLQALKTVCSSITALRRNNTSWLRKPFSRGSGLSWQQSKFSRSRHCQHSSFSFPNSHSLNTMQGSVRSRGFDFWQLLLLQAAHKLSCWKRSANFGALFRTQTLIGRPGLDWKNDGPIQQGNKTKNTFLNCNVSYLGSK